MNELESLSNALAAFDVVEAMPDDGDVAEINRQLELCVVCIATHLSHSQLYICRGFLLCEQLQSYVLWGAEKF